MTSPTDDEVTRRREAAAARTTGYYWVAVRHSLSMQVCRWVNAGEGDGSWYTAGDERELHDSEVFVASNRLERPDANIGWPDWAIQIEWER